MFQNRGLSALFGAFSKIQKIAFIRVTNNSAPTVIANSATFTDLNLDALAGAGSNIKRWELTDTTTGEVTYTGAGLFVGSMIASISVARAVPGPPLEFNFREVRNGVSLSDGILAGVELGMTEKNVTLIAPVFAVPGDRIGLQVENVNGSADVIIRHLAALIFS